MIPVECEETMTCSNGDERGVEEEVEEKAGKTLVVGMKMDAESRELLTWALVKVAKPGDRVIALHVLPPLVKIPESSEKPSTLFSVVKDFDNVLAVYDGFCNLKQIELKLKICRGTSIRRILVHEANSVLASTLILGVSKCGTVVGSTTSMAKFCAKKLSRGCLVLAVNNGKIVYEKDAGGNCSTDDLLLRSDSINMQKINVKSKNCEDTRTPSIYCPSNESEKDSIFDKVNISSSDNSPEEDKSRFDEASSCLLETDSKDYCSFDSQKKLYCPIVPEKKNENSVDSSPTPVKETPYRRPGWLLLRRSVTNYKNSALEKPLSSVVQWAMRRPSRRFTSSSVVHPDQKQANCYLSQKSVYDFDMNPLSPASMFEVKELTTTMLSRIHKYSSNCRRFSFNEVMQATSNFSPANIVGRGGTCKVYKGSLPDCKELAFKFLRRCNAVLLEDFMSEIEIITNLKHKNIISLYGFCFENNHLVLVYDFMSKGSLEENLHGLMREKNDLSWADRYKIAVGVAEALDYLHTDGGRGPVIHRDVKSSNILLDDDFEPQLCDFGLAQWASSSSVQNSEDRDSSDLAGTFGYLAPEYFMYGRVDDKIDVYAFGVVLLELLSGRKPVSTGCPKGEESLVMWAKPILQSREHHQLADPSLGDIYDSDEMERMCLASSLCISQASRSRPSMSLVLKLLKGECEAVEWAKTEWSASVECNDLEDKAVLLKSNIQSHINLALLNLDDDEYSTNSMDDSVNFITSNTSLEDYLKARCC